jgi:hypothetical protein
MSNAKTLKELTGQKGKLDYSKLKNYQLE